MAGRSPHVPDIRPILEATTTLTAATGILNVWGNDPAERRAGRRGLRADFPGRFVLGIGIGHPEATSDYRRPLTTMRAFLDGLDASPTPPPLGERCLAALGPRMLDLARERTAGAHRTSCPSSTRASRASGSGPTSSSCPSWPASSTPTRAAPGRRPGLRTAPHLDFRNYRQNLLDFGFTEAPTSPTAAPTDCSTP